jgi:hypothetical protein
MSSVAVTRGSVTYGFLEPGDERWAHVRAQFTGRGVDPPSEHVAVAYAETDGAFSFYCLQPILHAEPLYLHPAHRAGGRVLVNLLAAMTAAVEKVAETAQRVYVVADTPESVKLCEAMGCERVEVPVYVRTVRKPTAGGAM